MLRPVPLKLKMSLVFPSFSKWCHNTSSPSFVLRGCLWHTTSVHLFHTIFPVLAMKIYVPYSTVHFKPVVKIRASLAVPSSRVKKQFVPRPVSGRLPYLQSKLSFHKFTLYKMYYKCYLHVIFYP